MTAAALDDEHLNCPSCITNITIVCEEKWKLAPDGKEKHLKLQWLVFIELGSQKTS